MAERKVCEPTLNDSGFTQPSSPLRTRDGAPKGCLTRLPGTDVRCSSSDVFLVNRNSCSPASHLYADEHSTRGNDHRVYPERGETEHAMSNRLESLTGS